MRPLNQGGYDEIDKRIKYEESKLAEWGWSLRKENREDSLKPGTYWEVHYWTNPKSGKEYGPGDMPYTQAVCQKLEENGWKEVIEVELIGKKHLPCFRKDEPEKWGRFQSPKTNKLYSFLETMDILEMSWDEDKFWKQGASVHTIELNKLIGDNFVGDEVKTWFYLDGDDNVLALWEEKDGDIVEIKSVRTPKVDPPGNVVGWGPFGLEYFQI